MLDSFLTGLCNWKTTLVGLLAAAVIYVSQIGGKMPATQQEWWAFGWGVLALALGVVAKDATTGSRPRVILLALGLALLGLGGCASQSALIEALAKDPASNCVVLSSPYAGLLVARGTPGVHVSVAGGTCSIEHAK